jgi:hypothetical protein
MNERSHEDIHQLLKSFGITADEMVNEYIARYRPSQSLTLRIVLDDLTEYASDPPERLHLEVEGNIQVP